MAQFLIDFCLSGFYKGRKYGVLTPQYAKSTPRYAAKCGVDTYGIFANISVNSKPTRKYFLLIISEPRGSFCEKKIQGRKSRETVPLSHYSHDYGAGVMRGFTTISVHLLLLLDDK
jgi:hypothetical protein